jgi:uncharacterized protein (TIGR03435 family)
LALAKGIVAGGSTLILVKGALNLMAWAKAKTAVLVGLIGIVIAASAATYCWDSSPATFNTLDHAKRQVEIRPTRFPNSEDDSVQTDDQVLGINMPFQSFIQQAYGVDEYRIIIATELPKTNFDYIANLRNGSGKALQLAIRKQFGIIGHFKAYATNALVLKIGDPSLLKSHLVRRESYRDKAGMWFEGRRFRWGGQPSSRLANCLDRYFKMPVVNQTGMSRLQNYDFDLDWSEEDLRNRNSNKLKQALQEVGFGLIITNQPIEMLVVERVK